MTEVLFFILTIFILLFAGIVFLGAPYVPTKRSQIIAALDLLDLEAGQTLLELGAGDGRVAKAAAQRGIRVVGYELNPVLLLVAKISTWQYRDLVTIHWRNYLHTRWPKAEGIFIFSGDPYMARLNKKITKCAPDAKVASFAFKFAEQELSGSREGIYLYDYALAKRAPRR